MNKNTRQLIMTVTGTALSFTAVIAIPAEAAQFNTTFYDTSGQQVGVGSFTYSNTETSCIETELYPEACDPALDYPYSFFVAHLVTDFSSNVVEQSWSLAGKSWWSSPIQPPGQQKVDLRYRLIDIVQNSWTLGDLSFSTQALNMNIDWASNTSGGGSWDAFVTQSSQQLSYSGTWTASAVPEPLTILGSLSALGLGASFKRKLARKNNKKK